MRRLGDLEQLVMERIWARTEPVAVREVLQDLAPQRTLAYTTVMTVMDNLRRKGILTREKHGRAYLYRSVVTREQHTASLMEDVLHAGADRETTLLRFVEQMSVEEAARLREVLEVHLRDVEGGAP